MITIQNLSKSVHMGPDAPRRHLLRNINVEIPTGCLYGLIGPGASGKSVLLKMLAGLMKPDEGSIFVGEDDITQANEVRLHDIRRKIGMLFQNNALFDHITVAENIAFPLKRLENPSDDEVTARVAERLKAVSLAGFQDRMPAGLSGGQKKRVGVARATITRAPFVLYDEPAAGLDPVTSQKIFDLLREEQRASGATVVMVSSDLDRMLPVTDRIGMMYQGQLIFDGTTDEARRSSNPYVYQFVNGLTEGPL